MVICVTKKVIRNVVLLITLVSFMLAPLSVHSIGTSLGFLAPQKGMCYITWNKDSFASHYSDRSLEKLASLGVEYLAICPTHYQQKYNSTEINPLTFLSKSILTIPSVGFG